MASLLPTPVATPRYASVLQAQASEGNKGTQVLSMSRWDLYPSFWEPCAWEHVDYYDYPHPRTCTIVGALQSACMQGDYGPAEEFSIIEGPPLMSFNVVAAVLYLPRGDTVQFTLPEQSDMARNPASYFPPHIREKFYRLEQSDRCVLSMSTYHGPLLQIILPPRNCYIIQMPTVPKVLEPHRQTLGWPKPATSSYLPPSRDSTTTASILSVNSLLNPTETINTHRCQLVEVMRAQAEEMAYFADLGNVMPKANQSWTNGQEITSVSDPPSPLPSDRTFILPNSIVSEGNWTIRFMNCHCPMRLHIVVMGQVAGEEWDVPMALLAKTFLAHMIPAKAL